MVANSYDADATEVTISAPIGQLLANKVKGIVTDKNLVITVTDNGIGMTSDEVNDFYLKVGSERRNDPRRGDTTSKYGRRVMGRKGVGKLAPFGVCERIEVITSGGKVVSGLGIDRKKSKGHVISHLILERSGILTDVDSAYYPKTGPSDGCVRKFTGTSITLTLFDHRWVPEIEDFERQMAQRFGLSSPKWKIILRDSLKPSKDASAVREVGHFDLKLKPHTKIAFIRKNSAPEDSRTRADFETKGPSTAPDPGIPPGFEHEGAFFPITGWVGYAEKPYKDELMVGIRVYCRGKIAAQTAVFNLNAGFTGEHDVRSYLIGELHATSLKFSRAQSATGRETCTTTKRRIRLNPAKPFPAPSPWPIYPRVCPDNEFPPSSALRFPRSARRRSHR